MLFNIQKKPPTQHQPKLDKSPLLNQWQHLSRMYYLYFEKRKQSQLKSLDVFYHSNFTKYRTFSRWFKFYQYTQMMDLAQYMGDISASQMKCIQDKAKAQKKVSPLLIKNSPGQLRASQPYRAFMMGFSIMTALSAIFIAKYSKVFLLFPTATFFLLYVGRYKHQPLTHLLNSYYFLLERRSATVWSDLKKDDIHKQLNYDEKVDNGMKKLAAFMREKDGYSLIHLQQDIDQMMDKGLQK